MSRNLFSVLATIGASSCVILYFYSDFISIQIAWLVFICATSLATYALLKESIDLNLSLICLGNFWIVFSFFVIFLVSPMVIVLGNLNADRSFERYQWRESLSSAIILGALSLFSLALGSGLMRKKSIKKTNPNNTREFEFSNGRALVLLTLSTFMYSIHIGQNGGLSYLFNTRKLDSLTATANSSGYLADAPLIGVAVLLSKFIFEHASNIRKNYIKRFLILASILIFTVPYISRGSRSIFIFILIIYLVQNRIVKRKIRYGAVSLAVLVLLAPILIVAPRIYRQEVSFELTQILSAYSFDNIANTITGSDAQMVPALSILIQNLGNTVDFAFGKSYLYGLLKPIPRDIWMSKPLEFDTGLNLILFPQNYRSFGVAFSAVSEPLVNFGLLGVFAFFLILGLINANLAQRLNNANLRFIIFYSWTIAFMFILARGNLSTDYHRLVFPLVSGLSVIRRNRNKVSRQQVLSESHET